MKKEQILGIVRHALTFIGGFLITKGMLTETLSAEVIGGIMGLVGTIWSIASKKVA